MSEQVSKSFEATFLVPAVMGGKAIQSGRVVHESDYDALHAEAEALLTRLAEWCDKQPKQPWYGRTAGDMVRTFMACQPLDAPAAQPSAVTPEFVWLRLLEAMADDNGCAFTASTDDYREAKPAITALISAGFFAAGHDDLDGDIWMVAAGEQGEAAARFEAHASAYVMLSDVLNRVFERPAAERDAVLREVSDAFRYSGAHLKLMERIDALLSSAEPVKNPLQAEIDRLNQIINTPQADDFLRAVSTEAEHQRQRWGSEHDDGKTPADWFWLVGYLAGKALHAHASDNVEKAEHHVITTAAALANWHRAMFGKTNMRPGIAEPAKGGDGEVV